MPIMNDRWATLTASDRTVRLDADTALVYPGVALTRYEDGRVVGVEWLPQGEDPSEADDELLITHLRAALAWSCPETTMPPPAWGRGAGASS